MDILGLRNSASATRNGAVQACSGCSAIRELLSSTLQLISWLPALYRDEI